MKSSNCEPRGTETPAMVRSSSARRGLRCKGASNLKTSPTNSSKAASSFSNVASGRGSLQRRMTRLPNALALVMFTMSWTTVTKASCKDTSPRPTAARRASNGLEGASRKGVAAQRSMRSPKYLGTWGRSSGWCQTPLPRAERDRVLSGRTIAKPESPVRARSARSAGTDARSARSNLTVFQENRAGHGLPTPPSGATRRTMSSLN
mmetsp:Transcript_57922/g.161650  ORF Transcript_57922/g.161650 Transcript_57922/m.161650 type:complete len:206 (+) Transcript_57922:356-973(+)